MLLATLPNSGSLQCLEQMPDILSSKQVISCPYAAMNEQTQLCGRSCTRSTDCARAKPEICAARTAEMYIPKRD